MKRTIAFASPSDARIGPSTPVEKKGFDGPGFLDITVKEEYRKMKIKLDQTTRLRFLPAIAGSTLNWMAPIDYYPVGSTSLLVPTDGTKDLIKEANFWLRKNNPEAVYRKKGKLGKDDDGNENGVKLWPKKLGIAWAVNEQAPEGERLRVFSKSLYDGEFGGSTGLAYNIVREATSVDDEPGSATKGELLHGDITDPATGRFVKIDKAKGGEFASYNVSIGKVAAPMDAVMAVLTDAEVDMICPIDNILHSPTEAEQIAALTRYIGAAAVKQIFG